MVTILLLLFPAVATGIVLPPAAVAPRLLPAPQPRLGLQPVRRFVQEQHLLAAALQMGLVRGSADVIGQAMHGDVVDPVHCLAMVLTGLTTSGVGGALWLRHLETSVGPCSVDDGMAGCVLRKTALDFMCWSPSVISANLFFVSLLTVR